MGGTVDWTPGRGDGLATGVDRTRPEPHLNEAVHANGRTQHRVRVLIVENHQLVSEALSAMLSEEPDIYVVGTAASTAESMAQLGAFNPDIVLIDYHLTDGTGVTAAEAMRAINPNIRIIFISRSDGDVVRLQALEAGASGFVHKSKAATEMVTAIRAVAKGYTLFTPQEVSHLLGMRRRMASVEPLTVRETQVLRLLASGRASRDMATQLGITYATVRVHLRSIEQKLGAHTKVEALARARELGLVD